LSFPRLIYCSLCLHYHVCQDMTSSSNWLICLIHNSYLCPHLNGVHTNFCNVVHSHSSHLEQFTLHTPATGQLVINAPAYTSSYVTLAQSYPASNTCKIVPTMQLLHLLDKLIYVSETCMLCPCVMPGTSYHLLFFSPGRCIPDRCVPNPVGLTLCWDRG
jgi:hypothetical protein